MSTDIGTGSESIELRYFIITFIVLCVSYLLLFWKKKGNLPPGPRPLPIVGNLHQINTKDLVKSIDDLSKKFGSVFTIYLGPRPSVVLYGYKAVKEALVDQADSFSGRGQFPAVQRFTQGNGIAFSNGEKWKVLRRFALTTLRNFGMGKKSVEERIQEEAHFLLKELRKTKHSLVYEDINNYAVPVITCTYALDHAFVYFQSFLQILLASTSETAVLINSCWRDNSIFGLNWVFWAFYKNERSAHRKLDPGLGSRVGGGRRDPSQARSPRHLIDCQLVHLQNLCSGQTNQEPANSVNMSGFVVHSHFVLIMAVEALSGVMRRSVTSTRHPLKKKKVHQEIDKVIGRNRCPTIDDRSRMPYTDAVIHEIQRFTNIIPLSLPHCVTEDTNFRGFVLPKGTGVIPVLASVHADPEKYKEPQNFNPQNFLDENNRFMSNSAFMPFSTGS
ncbi:cytochrome P450 2F2 [Pelobates cultripes]|uniref:Cytochrome P450 2F2 n=1 Tax=Pelobates cultripes TaxID=61616 RepID=A0AAD1WMM3_PELCU|nr:cytochrome P450 2F2 [Pelobates cultripes]